MDNRMAAAADDDDDWFAIFDDSLPPTANRRPVYFFDTLRFRREAWHWSTCHERTDDAMRKIVEDIFGRVGLARNIRRIQSLWRRFVSELETRRERPGCTSEWKLFGCFDFIVEDMRQAFAIRSILRHVLMEYPVLFEVRDGTVTRHPKWSEVIPKVMQIIAGTGLNITGVTLNSVTLTHLWNNFLFCRSLLKEPEYFCIHTYPRIFHCFSSQTTRDKEMSPKSLLVESKNKQRIICHPACRVDLKKNCLTYEEFEGCRGMADYKKRTTSIKKEKSDTAMSEIDVQFSDRLLVSFLTRIYRNNRGIVFDDATWNIVKGEFKKQAYSYTLDELKTRWDVLLDRTRRKLIINEKYLKSNKLTDLESEILYYFPEVVKSESIYGLEEKLEEEILNKMNSVERLPVEEKPSMAQLKLSAVESSQVPNDNDAEKESEKKLTEAEKPPPKRAKTDIHEKNILDDPLIKKFSDQRWLESVQIKLHEGNEGQDGLMGAPKRIKLEKGGSIEVNHAVSEEIEYIKALLLEK